MARLLKRIFIALFSIILILVVAIAAIMMIVDPNDYKQDIVKAAHDKGGINLEINGNMAWSLMPLGLDINEVKVLDQQHNTFTQLNRLTAEINLASLFQMKPRVQRILIDGLELKLHKDAKGNANWTNIAAPAPSSSSKETTSPSTPEKPAAENDQPKAKKTIAFQVDEISITNTNVYYDDAQSGQSVHLKNFNLLTQNISLDKAFPFHIDFEVNNKAPQLDLLAKLDAKIKLGSKFKRFEISELKSEYKASGEPFGEKTMTASLDSNIVVDLNQQTAELSNFILKTANVEVKANLSVTELDTSPKIAGQLQVPPFSAQALLEAMGQKTIPTADAKALTSIGFKTSIATPAGTYSLNNIEILLDKTTYTGNLAFTPKTQKLLARLNGTVINIDDYLPPKPKKEKKDKITEAIDTAKQLSKAAEQKPAAPAPETDPDEPLLPLETIRGLNMDIAFTQQKVIVKNLKVNNIAIKFKANKGLVNLEEVSASLYEGKVFASGLIDARTDDVTWHIVKKIENIQTLPMLTDAADIKMLSGGINASVVVDTKGNTLNLLRSQAKGQADFNFDKATFHGINLNAQACKGVAMIPPSHTVDTSQWPAETALSSLKGHLNIDGNTLNNTELKAAASGLTFSGSGLIDLAKSFVNYELDLNVTGDLGSKDCKVNDRVKNFPIPVLCKGTFDTPPAELCKLNTAKMLKATKSLLKNEAKRKAKKAVGKLLSKKLGINLDNKKGSKASQKQIENKLKDKAKNKLKSLFKGF